MESTHDLAYLQKSPENHVASPVAGGSSTLNNSSVRGRSRLAGTPGPGGELAASVVGCRPVGVRISNYSGSASRPDSRGPPGLAGSSCPEDGSHGRETVVCRYPDTAADSARQYDGVPHRRPSAVILARRSSATLSPSDACH